MLLSLVHNGKITNIDVDCASWRNYCRTSNLILVYSSTLELQNKGSINFISTILNFQWLFFIWGIFFINLETLTQLRFMSNLEMWQNIRYNLILFIKHGVYQPGKPGNLREFFKPGILREISGNFKNSLEKWNSGLNNRWWIIKGFKL